jgi:hypothetical protein
MAWKLNFDSRNKFELLSQFLWKIFTAAAHRGPARQVAGCLAAPLSQLNQRFL